MGTYIPKADRQPHLFLSHSSNDKEKVTDIANDLAVCEIDVWLDKWEIEPGESIYKAINSGLDTSQYIALFVSNSFLKSKWGTAEVDAAFNRQIEENKKIIVPLLLEDVKLPSLLSGLRYLQLFGEGYFSNLAQLVGLIHGINQRTLSEAIIEKKPNSLEEVLEVLFFCGIDPYLILPKDVFDELAKLDDVEVDGNRLRFHRIISPLADLDVSGKTKNYLRRVWRGIQRDPNRFLY